MRKDRGGQKDRRKETEGGGKTVGKEIKGVKEWEERAAQCVIQSGDESQQKKLKAAAEISRLISIQIRHKFYMPSV